MTRCGLLTLDTVGGKETDVAGLQRIFMRELWRASLWLRFSCQRGVVHLHRDKEKRGVLPSETEGRGGNNRITFNTFQSTPSLGLSGFCDTPFLMRKFVPLVTSLLWGLKI